MHSNTETKDQKYPFPVEQQLSNEYLQQHFWKCLYTDVELPLQYWIVLPNQVKPTKLEPVVLKELRLTNIGQYTRIDASPYLEIQVAYEHNLYEMNASDWLLKKIASSNETVLNYRTIDTLSTGSYIDLLTLKVMPDGEKVISRFTVLKDYDKDKGGANYCCVKASCIEKDYATLADQIFQTVSNWDLIHKSDWQMAESLFPFQYDFAENVTFYVPASWEIRFETENTKSISRFILAHNILQENKGLINTTFYAGNEARDATAVFERSFNKTTKFEHELSPMELLDFRNPALEELWTTTGIVSLAEEQFSAAIVIYVIKTAKGWYYFEVIGPKPNLQNEYWEINKRCIELILNSFNNKDFTRKPIGENSKPPQPKGTNAAPENKWLLNTWDEVDS